LHAAYRFDEVWFGKPNEAGYEVTGAVTLADLRKSVCNGHGFAIWGCGHVAVGQRVPEWLVYSRELVGELIGEASLARLDDGAGVTGHEAREGVVGVGHIAEVTSTVERMEARHGNLWAVADVVQPGGSFEEIGVVTKDGCQRVGLSGNALGVRPATRKWLFQQLTRNFSGPGRYVVHGFDAMGEPKDVHGRMSIVLGRLPTTTRPLGWTD
jgi:hypothetical protein